MQYRAYARQNNIVTYPASGGFSTMVPGNLRFLIAHNEIGRIKVRLHSLVGELPKTCRLPIRKISCLPDEMLDPQR